MLAAIEEFKLRDGREAIITSPRVCYAQSCLNLMRDLIEETPFTGKTSADCADHDLDWQKKRIRNMDASSDSCMLVCVADGKFVATASIWRYNRELERHRGTITVAVRKDHWSQGIGTKLIQSLLFLGYNCLDMTQVELHIAADNFRAQELYHKLGFRTVSVHPNFYKRPTGYADRYLMVHTKDERE